MRPIPAGNHIVRPFVTHKDQQFQYTYLSGSNPSQIAVDLASIPPAVYGWNFTKGTEPSNQDGVLCHTLYASVVNLFYRSGSIWNSGQYANLGFVPTGSAFYVINVAQSAYGETIQPGTFFLTAGDGYSGKLVDDADGKLFISASSNVVFKYTPGDSLATATFTGPISRSYVDNNGVLRLVNLNVARDSHYIFNTASGQLERTLLLEASSSNWIQNWAIQSSSQYSLQIAATASVSPISMSLVPTGGPDGGQYTQLYGGFDSKDANLTQSIGSGVVAWRPISSSWSSGMWLRSSNGLPVSATINYLWSADDGTFPENQTSVIVTGAWKRYLFTAQAPKSSKNLTLRLFPNNRSTNSLSQSLDIKGWQLEENYVTTSDILSPATATGSRSGEVLSFPFVYGVDNLEMTVDGFELGTGLMSGSNQYIALLGVNNSSGSGAYLYANKTTNSYRMAFIPSGSTSVETVTAVTLPTFGQEYRLRGTVSIVSGSGSVSLGEKINQGTETLVSSSISQSVTNTQWYGNTFWLNSLVSGSQSGFTAIKEVKITEPVKKRTVGNIFYPLGIAVVNTTYQGANINEYGLTLTTGSILNIGFNATQTIYEHTIICTMEEGELNYSVNPSVSALSSSISGSGKIIDAFASGTLTPYMTTVGMYNSAGELMAVAKFPRALKRVPESQQTVIVRFDV